MIKEKDANGRKIISRKEINGESYVRVKSTAMTGENNMVCYDELGHDIMLPNYDKYNKDKDSEPLEKYTPRNHSCIGISFAGAITEHLTQAGLGFKH